jgi:hypothetical protein
MKKILCSILLSVFFISIYAQNERAVDTVKYTYCEILGYSKLFSKKVTIEVDFGQEMKYFTDQRIKDKLTGDVVIFNSMIDALNYFGKQGWEFVQAYAYSTGNSGNVYHYLMKKPTKILIEEEKKGKTQK